MTSYQFSTPGPCIALRRNSSKSPSSPSSPTDYTRPRSLDFGNHKRNSSNSSLNKLTGSPGYVTLVGSASPTKVLPSKPHHVRGGSIGSDLSDLSHVDQIIPMQACDSEMLVPLLHRHLEMKELIATNPARFARLRNAFGKEVYDKCTSLWTTTTRAEMNDLDWLKETQRLIKGQDNWTLWCEVVGWDSNDLLLDRSPKQTPTKSDTMSSGLLEVPQFERGNSTGSVAAETIAEEPED